MPAPKVFKPAPETTRDREPITGEVVKKGHYAVAAPPAPIVDDESIVIAVDDVTIAMSGESKYESRSFHAYGEAGDDPDEESAEAPAETFSNPEHSAPPRFGEWRSESTLEGSHYHRKDSRRI